ncbi:MAG: hypothetical protein BWY15_02422 [Firmicutes bacterium ADurb.Bin193]|nr:MAG: hypothetical protein BWY15_02422 [Firmicutes bacterium ADurb.Bin193]
MPDKKKTDKKNDENENQEAVEDTTMYDEFIPSYNSWLSSEIQRKRAKHLEEKVDK